MCCSAQFDKNKAVGPCINGRCPDGHVCHDDECFPAQRDDPMEDYYHSDQKSRTSIGPCVNDLCPAGYDCVDNKCYKSECRPGLRSRPAPWFRRQAECGAVHRALHQQQVPQGLHLRQGRLQVLLKPGRLQPRALSLSLSAFSVH